MTVLSTNMRTCMPNHQNYTIYIFKLSHACVLVLPKLIQLFLFHFLIYTHSTNTLYFLLTDRKRLKGKGILVALYFSFLLLSFLASVDG